MTDYARDSHQLPPHVLRLYCNIYLTIFSTGVAVTVVFLRSMSCILLISRIIRIIVVYFKTTSVIRQPITSYNTCFAGLPEPDMC